MISDLPVNQLIGPERVLRPRFGFPPRLRSMMAVRGRYLVVRKRDLRHYFHCLQIGRRWHKFLAHPAVSINGENFYPLHMATPMGFTPSAGIAQAVTDEATRLGNLPADRKVTFDEAAPAEWPVWSSIIDDVWTIEERRHRTRRDADTSKWLTGAERAFSGFGISINDSKTVDDGFGVEFQGAVIHPEDHWLGATVERRVMSTACAFTVLGRWEISSLIVERLNGKLGYDAMFRTCTRSLMQDIYLGWSAIVRGGVSCVSCPLEFGVISPCQQSLLH